ncbi:hypothetical protein Plhal304r1_c003g0010381 [Plasmopara halstedii]
MQIYLTFDAHTVRLALCISGPFWASGRVYDCIRLNHIHGLYPHRKQQHHWPVCQSTRVLKYEHGLWFRFLI